MWLQPVWSHNDYRLNDWDRYEDLFIAWNSKYDTRFIQFSKSPVSLSKCRMWLQSTALRACAFVGWLKICAIQDDTRPYTDHNERLNFLFGQCAHAWFKSVRKSHKWACNLIWIHWRNLLHTRKQKTLMIGCASSGHLFDNKIGDHGMNVATFVRPFSW